MSDCENFDRGKKKVRTLFSKSERMHLLKIMEEYAPFLDDKNLSILARKEIWLRIEQNFNNSSFEGRSSAQLKKYWQNYKYHNKRMKMLRNTVDAESIKLARTNRKIDVGDWKECENGQLKSQSDTDSIQSDIDLHIPVAFELLHKPLDLSRRKSVEKGDVENLGVYDNGISEEKLTVVSSRHDLKDNINLNNCPVEIPQEISKEFDLVVSNTEVTGNKVTVSVIRPLDKNFKSPSLNQGKREKDTSDEKRELESGYGIENLKRSAPIDFIEIDALNKVTKSARVNRNDEKSNITRKIPGKPCLILRQKNNEEKLVDRELKTKSLAEFRCGCSSSGQLDENLESERVLVSDSSNFSIFAEDYLEKILSDINNNVKRNNHDDDEILGKDLIKCEWNHRLLLRQLETKEMLLKLKIAEMAIQETRLRMCAIDEERNRARELHELRIVRISELDSL